MEKMDYSTDTDVSTDEDFFWVTIATSSNKIDIEPHVWVRIYRRRTAEGRRVRGGKQRAVVGLSKLHWTK